MIGLAMAGVAAIAGIAGWCALAGRDGGSGRIIHIASGSGEVMMPARPVVTLAGAEASVSDSRVQKLVDQWEAQTHGVDGKSGEDADRVAEVSRALAVTTARADGLALVSAALSGRADTADRLLGRHFLAAAVRRAREDLAARSDGGGAVAEDLRVLWECANSPAAEDEWQIQTDIYTTLAEWERAGTAQRYRARLKLADAQLYSGESERGLATMDSLMADVGRGQYSMANPHDIVPLYWALCHNGNRIDQGLAYLREVVRSAGGGADEQRMTGILIAALAETGHAAESRELLGMWRGKFGAIASRKSVDQLNRVVAVAEARENYLK